MESYLASVQDTNCSTSDRHHAKPEAKSQNSHSLPKTTSQFSILNNEHLSRNLLPGRTMSTASYDPYRASRGASFARDKNYLNVTVHGRNSRVSLNKSIHSNSRRPVSRVEALRHSSRRGSTTSSSISLRPPSVSVSQPGSRRSTSRQSFTQSISRTSLARSVVVKPHLHKRGVEFNHLRRSSTSSVITPQALSQSRSRSPRKYPAKYDSSPNIHAPASPPAGGVVIKSRKEGRKALHKPHKPPNHRTYSQVIAHDARQVSTELEKFCEQVFFRDSTDTSDRTSSTSHAPYDTPPSSLSNRGSYNAPNVGKVMMTPLAQDSKPRPPAETPNTFIARELLETKRRLADRYAKDENAQGVAYHEVMAHLDSLLQPGNPFVPDCGREYSPYLPVISEEGRSDADEARASRDVTARQPITRQGSSDNPNTIRMVLPSSPPQIKPLVIRKNSSESSDSRRSGHSDENRPSLTRPSVPGSHVVRKPTPTATLVLGTIAEEGVSSPTKSEHEESTTKKDNWFTRRFRSRDVSGTSQRSWDDLDDRQGGKQGAVFSRSKLSTGPGSGPLSPTSKDSSQTVAKVLRGKRPGFLKIFTRKRNQSERLSPGKHMNYEYRGDLDCADY
jgi:serine/threonine-protein kinase HSL1 (negative regulator of Swe1 kinase)